MMHIIIGLFFISLGIWGVFDEWYYVVDFVKGFSTVTLIIGGIIGIFAGIIGPLRKNQDEQSSPNYEFETEEYN
jgi:hypothetical protein